MLQRQKSLHIDGVSQNKYVSASMKGPSAHATALHHMVQSKGFRSLIFLSFNRLQVADRPDVKR